MKKQNGFTLLEIAISLLIIGFLLAGVLGPLSTQIEQKERQSTQAQLDNIREALLGFAITEGRLPCPDNGTTPDGKEKLHVVSGHTVCVVSSGSLPFVTLGIPELDAWGEHFHYAVTGVFADEVDGAGTSVPDPCGTAKVDVSFELCSVGDLDILSSKGGNAVVNNVPVVVFSTGKHKLDPSDDEQENTDTTTPFVYRDFSQADDEEFDDLMIWLSPNILKNRMVQAGRLP